MEHFAFNAMLGLLSLITLANKGSAPLTVCAAIRTQTIKWFAASLKTIFTLPAKLASIPQKTSGLVPVLTAKTNFRVVFRQTSLTSYFTLS